MYLAHNLNQTYKAISPPSPITILFWIPNVQSHFFSAPHPSMLAHLFSYAVASHCAFALLYDATSPLKPIQPKFQPGTPVAFHSE